MKLIKQLINSILCFFIGHTPPKEKGKFINNIFVFKCGSCGREVMR